MSKAVVAFAAALCVAGYVFVYRRKADPPIRSDGFSYYVYLPSWFLVSRHTLREVALTAAVASFPPSPQSSAGRRPDDGSTRIRSASPSFRRPFSSRPPADEMEQPVAGRLYALLSARRRPLGRVLALAGLVVLRDTCAGTSVMP